MLPACYPQLRLLVPVQVLASLRSGTCFTSCRLPACPLFGGAVATRTAACPSWLPRRVPAFLVPVPGGYLFASCCPQVTTPSTHLLPAKKEAELSGHLPCLHAFCTRVPAEFPLPAALLRLGCRLRLHCPLVSSTVPWCRAFMVACIAGSSSGSGVFAFVLQSWSCRLPLRTLYHLPRLSRLCLLTCLLFLPGSVVLHSSPPNKQNSAMFSYI